MVRLTFLVLLLLSTGCSDKSKITCTYGKYFTLRFDYITMQDAEMDTMIIAQKLHLPDEKIECLKELF